MISTTILLLCVAAFVAGFVDAIVGGGGLIQVPCGLILLPQLPVSNVIGTLKFPAFCGTSFAAYQYVKKQKINWSILLIMMGIALVAAFLGSQLLTVVSNSFMKPVLLVVLSCVAIYTFFKKDFGQQPQQLINDKQLLIYSLLISLFLGIYDGFVGPGTGSLLVLAFVGIIGYDFLTASTNAKMVNLATNFGSVVLFFIKGKIIWNIALPMAICNGLGGMIGAKFAIKKGNKFVRIFFLCIVSATLLRFGFDIFNGK
jgi:uncharacterized membrane protein YfcA